MLVLNGPPNKERYVAEIHNLLAFNCGTLCVRGRPRASARELARALGGAQFGARSVIINEALVSLKNNYTLVERFSVAAPAGGAQLGAEL
jgi:hypothetical protein